MSFLPDAAAYKRLVDGSAGGPAATGARIALGLLSVPYGTVVRCRNRAYDLGLLPIHACSVPVICVGNLTVGGTGKTPLVAWVVRYLERLGMRPAIVSRGYGARRGQQSDEAAELGLLLPGVHHVADADRVAAARQACASGADLVVLDDGFQHRRLARDLDIVAVDATDPFGCGHLFPRGLLREPLAGLARADAVVLTRSSLVDASRRAEIHDTLARHWSSTAPVWAEASHRLVCLRQASGATLPLDAFQGRRIAAFAGIGNPAAFRSSLASLGGQQVGFRTFADHHPYSRTDLASIAAWARDLRAERLVTTLKDLVKIGSDDLEGSPLAAAEMAIDFCTGGEEMVGLIGSVARADATSSFRRAACASGDGASTS